jgi:hypothetical protein
MAAEILLLVSAVGLAVILFVLLRPVSRDLALLALAFNLVTIAIEAGAAVHLAAALFPLGSAGHLRAFQPEQLASMATLLVRGHTYGFGVALIFFGCECVVVGHLIWKSGYLPKAIGVLMQIAGASYLANNFALLLAPGLAHLLLLVPAFIGEVSLAVWLLVRGVNLDRWDQRQRALSTTSPRG